MPGPRPGCAAVEEWAILSPSFLDGLSGCNAQSRIIAFDHDLKVDEDFSWRGLLTVGEDLLNAVYTLYAETKVAFHWCHRVVLPRYY